jgi:SnoaL-like domain
MESHPYRQAFAERELERLVALLADDVVFHSPVIDAPGFEGRDSVAALYSMIFNAISDVEYTHEIGDEGAHILVNNARMLGKPFKATTLLELNPDGKIREIWVMARPLTGVVAIAETIGSQLAKRRGPGGGPALRAFLKPLVGLAAVANRIGSRLIATLNRSTA